jgi:predicted nucleic acid-binding protein
LAAARRGGRIDDVTLRSSVIDLESACDAMSLIGVDWALAQHAGELAERHGLRGYDAVHLATALAAQAAGQVLVTWDRDLGRAAATVGIAVVPG